MGVTPQHPNVLKNALAAPGGAALIGYQYPGASTRTLGDKLVETASLLDFIPAAEHSDIKDGTTTYEATANINDWLAIGGRLYLPRGTFLTSGDHASTSKVHIFGPGTIKLGDNTPATDHLLDLADDFSEIQGVEFDGNAANNTSHTGRAELLRISGNDVRALDIFSHNSPKGTNPNDFYVHTTANRAVVQRCRSKGAGRAGFRNRGNFSQFLSISAEDFELKGWEQDNLSDFTLIDGFHATSSITPAIAAGECLLMDPDINGFCKLFIARNLHLHDLTNFTDFNILKLAKLEDCLIEGFDISHVGGTGTITAVRLQESVKRLTFRDGTIGHELNYDANSDYEHHVYENVKFGDGRNATKPGVLVNQMYAEIVDFINCRFNGYTTNAVKRTDWTAIGGAVEPTITFVNPVLNADSGSVKFIGVVGTFTPGTIRIAGQTILQGDTSTVSGLTGASGNDYKIQRNLAGAPNREFINAAKPSSGTYKVGDKVRDRTPAASTVPGWVCVTAPTTFADMPALGA